MKKCNTFAKVAGSHDSSGSASNCSQIRSSKQQVVSPHVILKSFDKSTFRKVQLGKELQLRRDHPHWGGDVRILEFSPIWWHPIPWTIISYSRPCLVPLQLCSSPIHLTSSQNCYAEVTACPKSTHLNGAACEDYILWLMSTILLGILNQWINLREKKSSEVLDLSGMPVFLEPNHIVWISSE